MNTNDLFADRYSCRKFADTPLEASMIEELLQAARSAPSACNAQPYFFYVLGPEAMNKVASLRSWYQAPVVILGCLDTENYGWQRASDGALFSSFDLGLAMNQLVLKATELHLGSCYIASFDPEELSKALDLPKNHVPYIAVALGHASMGPSDNHYLRQSPDKLFKVLP